MIRTAHSGEKIEEALDLLREASHDKRVEIEELLSGKYADLREMMHGVTRSVVDHAEEWTNQANRVAHKAATSIDKKVHDEPWQTMGLTTLAAFVAGFLLGRKE